uniref:N-alpha-acetyltransferase 40, NatD catalytic subunit n=1 Tax=Gallus gallus TaxID=9031 RepID=A0A8V0X343_CHICK
MGRFCPKNSAGLSLQLRGAAGKPSAAQRAGQVPPADPTAGGQQHADEESDADGLQAQPRRLSVLPRSAARAGDVRAWAGAGGHGAGSHERFDIDDSSPSVSGCCGDDCSYEVLSRRTKFGDGHQLPAAGHCGTCCH